MKYHDQIADVANRIAPYVRQTPLVESEHASVEYGAKVFLKAEVLQYTGSFKARGAANKIMGLKGDEVIVTASGGNHGLAVTRLGVILGHKVKVFLPSSTPQYKAKKIEELGGKVIIGGDAWDDANILALAYAQKEGAVYVHPFDDDEVIAGQATVAYEILQGLPDVDIIVGSVGGGGLMSGVSQYVKSFNPQIKVYAVETYGADSMYQSLEAGHIVELSAITSIAEGLGARRVTDRTFQIFQQNIDKMYRVTDEEAITAQLDILQNDKLLTEPASSCNLAVLKQIPDLKGKKVAVILCGGNFPIEKLQIKEKP